MRKFIIAAVAVASLAIIPTAAMANASGKPASSGVNAGVTENGWVGTTQGGGTATTQYSASYTDPVFGGRGTAPPYVGQTVSWNSDYYGVKDPNATHNGSMTITSVAHDSNGNVTSYTGLATYTS
jgi:hypothetical protein